MIFRNNIPGLFNRNRVNKADRPVIRPEKTPVDWLLEATAFAGLMFSIGFAVYYFPRLPETIPSHFDASGLPDGYSSKSTFLMLPGIGLFVYILLSFIVLVPNQFNYAVKITPANALKQYALAIKLIRYLKAAVIWLFFYISYATIRVAENEEPGLGLWFLPIVLGGIMLPVIIYMIVAFRHK
jgi:uncharacterized membrane protein